MTDSRKVEVLEKIRDVAHNAISHVGRANYRERQAEAHQWVNDAFDALATPSPSPVGVDAMREALERVASLLDDMVRVGVVHTVPDEACGYFVEQGVFDSIRAALASAPQSVPADEIIERSEQ